MHNLLDQGHHEFNSESEMPVQRVSETILGKGGFGTVYKVRLHGTRDAAQKVIDAKAKCFRVEQEFRRNREQLLAEANHMRTIASHRHIIGFYSAYEVSNEHSLGMFVELADGGSLRDQMRRQMTDQHKRWLIRQLGCIAVGIEYLHQHPMRHRDIKPMNILVHQGSVKISDFGSAYNAQENSGITTTHTPNPVRTRKYMPPEVNSSQPRNTKSDIFSLGATFVDVLLATGVLHLPETACADYCDPEKWIKVRDILDEAAKQASQSKLMRRLYRLCGRMLRWAKEERPSAQEVVRKLMEDSASAATFFCSACRASSGGSESGGGSGGGGFQLQQQVQPTQQVQPVQAPQGPVEGQWIWSEPHQMWYWPRTGADGTFLFALP